MAINRFQKSSAYAGSTIIITTKHAKSIAIAPPFLKKLNAHIIEYVADTDMLGTFSGEKKRVGTALECARKKCELSFEKPNSKVEFALASEGSFGPHPLFPFVACNQEFFYFIDLKRDFHLHLSHLSEKTNYNMQALNSLEELEKFTKQAKFPSHGLILRPNTTKNKEIMFKGITSQEALENAFYECLKTTSDGKIWVETDMRAQFNPSRMSVIGELATRFAERLATNCPKCSTPGWGKIREKKGLACEWCDSETDLIKLEFFGCTKCNYEEINERPDHLKKADPSSCQYCNP